MSFVQIWEVNPPKPAPHTITECEELSTDDTSLSSGALH